VLHLAGPWRLTGHGAGIDIASRKARALLCHLSLCPEQRQSREALARLLWDDSDPPRARASLRQVLAGLNRSLAGIDPPLILIRDDDIALTPGVLATDVDALLAAMEAGLPDDLDARAIGTLPQLLFADHGDISPEFDIWRRETGAHLCARLRDRLTPLMTNAALPRQTRMRAAQAALAMDDLDEAAVRAIMACHVEAGSDAAALRVYADLYTRLEDGMDTEPSAETQALAVAIKLRDRSAELPATAPAKGMSRVPDVTVAVLPFEFLGNGDLPDFVILGLLDQITCHLASYRAPAVISSNSTRRYRGQTPRPAQIRQDIRADYVVTGNLLRQGADLSVSVQLAETASEIIHWAGRFRCAEAALFDIRGNIADGIAHAVMPSVDLAELRRARETPAETLEPYHLVLRAKELIFELDRTAFDLAGTMLSQATGKAPDFAPAHALRAEWYALRLWQGWSDSYADDRIALDFHAGRSITLSPGNGRSLALLGHCRMMFERRHDEALTLFDRAVELHPNDSETLIWTVPTLAFAGQAEAALENGTRATGLSPLDPFRFRNEHFLSIAHYVTGDLDRAADLGLSSWRRAPDYGSNLRTTIAALERAGRRDEAAPLVAHHMAILPGFTVSAYMPNVGLQNPADRQLYADAMIAAGLPH
jgi:DNA-binding SARP family transcriptional activator